MTEHSTIHLERTSPQIAKVTFTNPPVNLIVGETVVRLAEIVTELQTDPDIQVVVFDSGVPDFFFNHFDLGAAADFPAPDGEDAVPIWTDVVLKLTKAPYITVASIRGRTRGGGNELALAFDLRYASREKALFGQPEVGSGLLPGGGGTERLPRAIGRSRALEVILTSADYDADTAERWGWITRAIPDAELDLYVDGIVQRLASFDRSSLASAKAMVNRAVLPPDGDLVAAYDEFAHSLTLPGFQIRAAAPTRSSLRPVSTSSTGSANTSASPTSNADDLPRLGPRRCVPAPRGVRPRSAGLPRPLRGQDAMKDATALVAARVSNPHRPAGPGGRSSEQPSARCRSTGRPAAGRATRWSHRPVFLLDVVGRSSGDARSC